MTSPSKVVRQPTDHRRFTAYNQLMKLQVVVLGAGFGGLELTSKLHETVSDRVELTLIDRSDAFVFGFSKIDVMFGRQTADEVRLALSQHHEAGRAFSAGDDHGD